MNTAPAEALAIRARGVTKQFGSEARSKYNHLLFPIYICIVEVASLGHFHIVHRGKIRGAAEDRDIFKGRATVFDGFCSLLLHDHRFDPGYAFRDSCGIVEDQTA